MGRLGLGVGSGFWWAVEFRRFHPVQLVALCNDYYSICYRIQIHHCLVLIAYYLPLTADDLLVATSG